MPAIAQLARTPSSRNAPSPNPSTTQSSCTCANTYNLQCEQGATLSSQITITLNNAPVDITGNNFQFTAKLSIDDADTAPTTVEVNWTETTTPTQGQTFLVIPAATTQTMQLVGYYYQVRMVSSSSVVTPLFNGLLTIVQPVSSRFV